MPRSRSFQVSAMEELLEQLRYAPTETRIRQMSAAEALVGDIDSTLQYPVSFVAYRITGFRSESANDAVVDGSDVLSDLGTFIQRLSGVLSLSPTHDGREAMSLDDVAAALGVSRKSVSRYRARGLVCHEVLSGDGPRTLVCFRDALERYQARDEKRLQRAGSFSRIGADESAQLIEAATRLRSQRGWSLQRIAERLGAEQKRSTEAVRQLLVRHDAGASVPLFSTRAPLSERAGQIAARAYRMGVPMARLADRFGRSRKTIHRMIIRARAEAVCAHPMKWVELPTFEMPDADEVLLASSQVRTRLDEPAISQDGLDLIRTMRAAGFADADEEATVIVALNFLKRRASFARAQLGTSPTVGALDAVETDMRWAALLMRRVGCAALGPCISAVEQHVHREIEALSADVISTVLEMSVRVVVAAVDVLDPSRSQRLERLAAQGMDRALAAAPIADVAHRASARHARGVLSASLYLDGLSPWAHTLSPPWHWREHLSELSPEHRQVLMAAFGWDGRAPMTMAALAEKQGRSVGALATVLRGSRAALLAEVARTSGRG